MAIPDQPFGFVAGRWVLSKADTPMDSDRAPDYEPLHPGAVIFTNKLSHRVVQDGTGTVGIVKTRIEGQLNSNGDLIDAEGHNFIALPVGVYSVAFSFGQYSWPNFDIEVKAEHTIDSPLWLPSKSPVPAGPGIVHVVSEEARLAAEAAAASAWAAVDTPGRRGPQGDRGPAGHLGFMSDTPRIVNLALGRELETSSYYHHYKSPPIGMAEGDIIYTHRVFSNDEGPNHSVVGSIVIFDSSTIHTYLVGPWRAHASAERFVKSKRVEIASPVPETASISFYGENPTAPALFSDINIINLTQVYGAGNEPSLEYMDALVEKHGGYIDGEQYVVGDALRSQTLAGQGMGVRVDNSVGTRVFLDHPGGSTMLWGDTGWRRLYAWDNTGTLTTGDSFPAGVTPIPEVAGWIDIRRTTGLVHLALHRIRVTGSAVIPLPVGFRARPIGTKFEPTQGIISISASVFITAGDWGKSGATGMYADEFAFPPANAIWPTSLPGASA